MTAHAESADAIELLDAASSRVLVPALKPPTTGRNEPPATSRNDAGGSDSSTLGWYSDPTLNSENGAGGASSSASSYKDDAGRSKQPQRQRRWQSSAATGAAAASAAAAAGGMAHRGNVSSSERLRALHALKEKRTADLVREKYTIKALQIAVAKKQKEIDASTKRHFEEMEKKLTRQEHRLPLWGLAGEQNADVQFLTDLRERREALYQKVGRPDGIGNRRTYLATYELHPQDLERQAAWEDALSAGIN